MMNILDYKKNIIKYDELIEALNKALMNKFNYSIKTFKPILTSLLLKYGHQDFFKKVISSEFKKVYIYLHTNRKETINYLVNEFNLIYNDKYYRKKYLELEIENLDMLYTLAKLRGY